MKRILLCICLALVMGILTAHAEGEKTVFETVVPGEYLVGPGDVLQVFVWGDEQLTSRVAVRPDGEISLPLIGDVEAGGRSVEDIRTEVDKRYKRYVTDAPVSVMLVELNYPKIYIMGKVVQPGVYIMSHPTTVTQALAMAQGFTPFADTYDVILIRGLGDSQIIYEYDYEDIMEGKELLQNVILQPNDTIVVP